MEKEGISPCTHPMYGVCVGTKAPQTVTRRDLNPSRASPGR